MNEKERVYSELDSCRRRIFELRKQNRALQEALQIGEIRDVRAERDFLRKTLSRVLYGLEQGDSIEDLAVIAQAGLVTKNKGSRARRSIQYGQIKKKLAAQAREAA